MNKIAFFDVDGTLIKGQTQKFLAFEAFKNHQIGIIELFDILLFFLKYKLGIERNVEVMMNKYYSLIKGWKREDFENFIVKCFNNRIKNNIFDQCLPVIQELRHQGYQIFLISNTVEEIVNLLAKELELDGGFGTKLESLNGLMTGKIEFLAYGENKVYILKKQFGDDYDFSDCFAYSDNNSDLFLLQLVGYPVVVNPDGKLKKIAKLKDWPILNFKF
jgi:HAD superfamily hydrolase (TIGR01490 family)